VRIESSPRFKTCPSRSRAASCGDPKLYAESFEHAREAFPPDSLVSRDGVARVIETMRAFDAVPAGMKMVPESVYDNRFVLKALGR
jgi:hypothetical protein